MGWKKPDVAEEGVGGVGGVEEACCVAVACAAIGSAM